jgi:hypothetical protein
MYTVEIKSHLDGNEDKHVQSEGEGDLTPQFLYTY